MRQPPARLNRRHLVGQRVVVRYHLDDPEFDATDAVGTLESWSDGRLRVRRDRRGDVVDIDESDVVAVKAVPVRGVTRQHVRDLEAAATRGWRALETRWLGGWLMRAAAGFTRRANSCLPLDDPGIPIGDAITQVETWYRDRGLVPTFQVPEPLGRALGPLLDGRGWSPPKDRVVVLTAATRELRAARRPHLPTVRIDDRPDAAWLAGYHYRGGVLPDGAMDVLVNAETVGFASVDEAGRRVAVARGCVSDSPGGHRWLGITAVEVAADARRRGLGSHIVAALAAWAEELGAGQAYLQVTEDNTAGMATYRTLGFTTHHHYHYRQLPPASRSSSPHPV